MEINKDIEWFRKTIAPYLKNYKIDYRTYSEGDLGGLDQVQVNSKEKGGNVDFWGLGYLGIFLWDYQKDEEIMNVLLDPNQEQEKDNAFKDFQNFLD
jgi:hypothetical protein